MIRSIGTMVLLLWPFILFGKSRSGIDTIFWHLIPENGASPELTDSMEKQLRQHFESTHGSHLMSGMKMDSLLLVEGNEKFLRCGTSPECLSGLAKVAEVKRIISGSVEKENSHITLKLLLIDATTKKVIFKAKFEPLREIHKTLLQEMSMAMFDPTQYRGRIELTCGVGEAEILLDGEKVGVTPLTQALILPAGVRHLVIKKPGHQTFSKKIRIPVGESKRVVALLPEDVAVDKDPVPFHKNWIFWTAISVGAIATAVASGLVVDANTNEENAAKRRDANLDWQAWQDRADQQYLSSAILYGVGGVALLTAGVLAVLDVYSDDQQTEIQPNALSLSLFHDRSKKGIQLLFHF